MKKRRSIRLPWKILFLIMSGILALTLLVACNGFPTVTPSPDEEPPEPVVKDEELAESPAEELSDAATSEKLPGAEDFTGDEEQRKVGAVLASPAFDMFLRIDGVPGESTDDQHGEWIEILSYSWGVSQPGASSLSTGGARSAERSDHEDFSVVKTLDKSSPKLALFSCNGTHIDEIVIELCRATGDKQTFMEYKMTDVIISSVRPSGTAGEALPLEEVTFSYGRIEWTYTEIDPETDKSKGDIKAHWDLTTNSGG